MNLNKLYLTKNECYLAGRTMTPKGIMVHSTGANNPNLRRYVGPDDGNLGKNQYDNHWNTARPGGRQVCVHAFIGKLSDGSIATYQTLPWNYVGWHSGSGSLGQARNANNTGYIGFEICEDGLTDADYFNKVYTEAVELCVYLCRQYGFTERNIICHSEGHALGIASNHADVMHWFPRHGRSMDTFRDAVKKELAATGAPAPSPSPGETFYRVRKSWNDAKSQKGAFRVLDNAKRCADENTGYSVFDEEGKLVYSGKGGISYDTYTVKKGDTLWGIAAAKLGSGARHPEITVLNGLNSDTIFPGQKLKIPK